MMILVEMGSLFKHGPCPRGKAAGFAFGIKDVERLRRARAGRGTAAKYICLMHPARRVSAARCRKAK
jgi:hypothetical protein